MPQVQFFARVLDIPAACRDWYAQCKTVQQTMEISQVQFLAWLSTRPLLCNDRCMGALLGSTVDTYLRQFEDGFMDEFLTFST